MKLRAVGTRVLVAAMDADQYEERVGGLHIRYELDPETGLAMAVDRILAR